MHSKIEQWLRKWKRQGYPDDIPDEVPDQLMHENLAPSWKQVAIAILKNDHGLKTLGFPPENSAWYNVMKREEIRNRDSMKKSEEKPKETHLEFWWQCLRCWRSGHGLYLTVPRAQGMHDFRVQEDMKRGGAPCSGDIRIGENEPKKERPRTEEMPLTFTGEPLKFT